MDGPIREVIVTSWFNVGILIVKILEGGASPIHY